MTGAQTSMLQRWGRHFGVEVDASAIARLATFVSLLDVWNRRIRLTGERDPAVIVEKHLPDCLAVAGFVRPGMRVADVGSGAGLPGVVVASVIPEASMRLVESRRRPASFLRELVRTLPLPHVEVVEDRWESWAGDHPQSLDLVTGRAIRLDVLLGQAVTVLAPGGRVVGMQSQHPGQDELEALAARYDVRLVKARAYELPSGEPRQMAIFGLP
jgi:16S rRNA (guanine527-N7)-methyltransferase